MLEPRVFLTDFGLAKNCATGSRYTRTGETLGTPAYMSPEQTRGELADLTPASDVWALGCVLYELLANRRAFEGDNAAAIVAAVVSRSPVPLRRLRSDVPRLVLETVMRALDREPRGRPSDAGSLGRSLASATCGAVPRPDRVFSF